MYNKGLFLLYRIVVMMADKITHANTEGAIELLSIVSSNELSNFVQEVWIDFSFVLDILPLPK